MNLRSADYAALADDAYRDRDSGPRAPGSEERVLLNGHAYDVLEHRRNPLNGYQGTLYRRVDSGELVVAHRGSEQLARDVLLTDAGMLLARINLQAGDAIALTRHALAVAGKTARESGQAPPTVSVTGHSLGGTLAQISAHHFNLGGHTFNAYGAAGLGYRIAAGGQRVLNHAMAIDPISAAAPHYGQLRLYATAQDIRVLHGLAAKESGPAALLGLPAAGTAAITAQSVQAHRRRNFLGADSVLDQPQALQLADDHAGAINAYRQAVGLLHGGVTLLVRGAPGIAVDVQQHLLGPLPPGAPARHEVPAAMHEPALPPRPPP